MSIAVEAEPLAADQQLSPKERYIEAVWRAAESGQTIQPDDEAMNAVAGIVADFRHDITVATKRREAFAKFAKAREVEAEMAANPPYRRANPDAPLSSFATIGELREALREFDDPNPSRRETVDPWYGQKKPKHYIAGAMQQLWASCDPALHSLDGSLRNEIKALQEAIAAWEDSLKPEHAARIRRELDVCNDKTLEGQLRDRLAKATLPLTQRPMIEEKIETAKRKIETLKGERAKIEEQAMIPRNMHYGRPL